MNKKRKERETNTTFSSNIRLILGVVIAVSIILLLNNADSLFRQVFKKEDVNLKKQENPLQISGVKIADFYKKTNRPKTSEYVYLAKEKNYHIFYFSPDELFMLSIVGYPFNDILPLAEERFLTELNITKDEACKLNVNVTTPAFANPDKAGRTYPLSFCGK